MIDWPVEPQNTKYAIWYERLITKAKNRTLAKESYFERHHIIPRSMGGADDKNNLVKLLAREHYVAHALLWKMRFKGDANMKMVHAFNQLSIMYPSKNHPGYKINSRLFEAVKLERSQYLKSIRGPDHPSYGKKLNLSKETILARNKKILEYWNDPEWRAKQLQKRKLFFESPEGIKQRKANGDRWRGTKRDPAIMEKIASQKRGKKATEIFSQQAQINIAEGRKHRVYKEETAKARDEMIREIGRKPKSEDHKKKISESSKGKHNHSGKNNPMFGKKHSPETLEKIRQTKLKNRLKVDNKEK